MKIKILFACLLLAKGLNAQLPLNGMPNPTGPVYAIEKIDNMIYFGGNFNQVSGQPHIGIARFEAATGTLSSWNPVIGINGGVNCITQAGNKLIVGGSFLNVNSQSRWGICMFDLTTGTLDNWTDTANYISWRQGIGTDNNYFYFCKRINSLGKCKVVCVDASTGNYTSWQSDSIISGDINAILVSGGYVYLGGKFGLGNSSSGLCRFDQVTGALDTAWHPRPNMHNFGVTAIVKTNGYVFVGGDFDTIAGQSRKGVAAFDANGNLTSFNQNSSSYEVLSLCPDGNYIWVGGNSWLLGGQTRYRIAQIRISNSQATCWDASLYSNTWSTVQALLVTGDTVYAGPTGNPELSAFYGNKIPHVNDTLSGPTSVFATQTVTYSVPNTAGYTYYWNVSGGTGTSTTNSINVTWGTGTTGIVKLVENAASFTNCFGDTIIKQVTITPTTTIQSISSEIDNDVSVFPNPTMKDFTICCRYLKNESSIVKVYNMMGKEMCTLPEQRDKCQSYSLQLKNGIYYIKLEIANKTFIRKLFVVE